WRGQKVFALRKRLFTFDGLAMLAESVDETVVGQLDQERAQVSGVGEVPAGVTESPQHVGPDRLNDIEGVELGAEARGEVPAGPHPQVRLVGNEDLFGGLGVAAGELLQQGVQRICAHARSYPSGSGGPPNRDGDS